MGGGASRSSSISPAPYINDAPLEQARHGRSSLMSDSIHSSQLQGRDLRSMWPSASALPVTGTVARLSIPVTASSPARVAISPASGASAASDIYKLQSLSTAELLFQEYANDERLLRRAILENYLRAVFTQLEPYDGKALDPSLLPVLTSRLMSTLANHGVMSEGGVTWPKVAFILDSVFDSMLLCETQVFTDAVIRS